MYSTLVNSNSFESTLYIKVELSYPKQSGTVIELLTKAVLHEDPSMVIQHAIEK